MLDSRPKAMRVLALALAVVAAVAIAPFWAPLVLAAWFADLLQPLVRALQRRLGGRRRGAAAIVVLLVVVAAVPLVVMGVEVVIGLRDLARQLRSAFEGQETLAGVLLGDGHSFPTTRELARLATRYPGNVWKAGAAVAQASVWVLLWILVFVSSLYNFAANGLHNYRWLARHAPIPRRAFTRLARAFRETGRGIIVGGGGTALAQGATATAVYVAVGVPRAWLLGPLTAIAALVPVIGTGLVWIPLAIELAVRGDYVRAVIVAVTGAVVISVLDNLLRPVLTRFGRLKLPLLVVLVSMLGGIAAFGPWGALLGPLVVRMAAEAADIARDEWRVTSKAGAVVLPAGSTRSPRSPDRLAL
jgi:predicted PurR-regulated permease PerM